MSKLQEMEKELDRLGLERQDRERILDLVLEAMIESEREMRLEHGAQILEAILGLRFQEDASMADGDSQARDRLGSLFTIASERARRPLAAESGRPPVLVYKRTRAGRGRRCFTPKGDEEERRLVELVIVGPSSVLLDFVLLIGSAEVVVPVLRSILLRGF